MSSEKRTLQEIYDELESLDAAGALTHAEWRRLFAEAKESVTAEDRFMLAGFTEHLPD